MASIISAGTTSGTSLNLSGDTSGVLQLATNGSTTAVTINTSQNVGIGTSSPTYKLDITDATTTTEAGGIRLTLGSEARSHLITNTTPNAASGRDLGILAWRGLTLEAGNGTTEGVLAGNAYEYITFGTGSSYTERMRITSGGTAVVGIGVNPSAWGASALQIGLYSGYGVDGNGYSQMVNNAYNDTGSNYRYSASSLGAQLYRQAFSSHQWFSAASGTAGNAITFTQVLGVGLNTSVSLQGANPQSGTGITFPATQSASSDANTLDDYEEGNWTPSYGGGITAATYGSARAGTYIKIGRSVTVHFVIMTDSVTRGSGGVTITGLPFTSSSATGSEASLSFSGAFRFDSNPPLWGRVGLNATTIALYSSINATGPGTDPVAVAPTDLNTGSGNRNIIVATVTYFTS